MNDLDYLQMALDEAIDELKYEIDVTCDCAGEDAETSAFFWRKIMELKAEPNGEKLMIEVAPEHVATLLRSHFEEYVDVDIEGAPEALVAYWRMICPTSIQLVYDEDDEVRNVMVTEG